MRRNLIARLIHDPTGTKVDLSIGLTEFEQGAIERATHIETRGVQLPIVSAEDLLVMKAHAGREQDIADIGRVLDRNANLDHDHVRLWLRVLQDASDDDAILARFDDTVARWERNRRIRQTFVDAEREEREDEVRGGPR